MLPNFEKAVRAIADTLVEQGPLPASAARREVVASFLLASHARMPDYLRIGILLLTLIFDAWSYPTSGRPFHRLALNRRIRQIAYWEGSRLKVQRSLAGFYRTLATFGLYTDLFPQDYQFDAHSLQH